MEHVRSKTPALDDTDENWDIAEALQAAEAKDTSIGGIENRRQTASKIEEMSETKEDSPDEKSVDSDVIGSDQIPKRVPQSDPQVYKK